MEIAIFIFMSLPRYLLIYLFILAFCYSPVLKGQEESKDINYLFDLQLEELFNVEINGASRILKRSASDVPAKILTITRQQISDRGYTSIIEVFEDLPDFKVDRLADPRSLHDVSIRGLRYMDKFIILIDGVRVTSPTNEIIPVLENYPVHIAEQIEIMYGPASALYGADAFSGIINIISRKPEDIKGTEMQVSTGMYNYVNANLLIGKKVSNKVGFTIAGQFMHDEQPNLSEYYPQEYAGGEEALRDGTFNTVEGPITPNVRVSPLEEHPISAYGIHARINVGKLYINYFGNYSRIPSTTANSPLNSVYNRSSYLGQYINTGNLNYAFSKGKLTSTSYLVGSRYDLDPWSNFRNTFTGMEPAYLYSYSWMLKAEQILNYQFSKKSSLTLGVTFERFLSYPRSNDYEYPLSKRNPQRPVLGGTVNNFYPDGIYTTLKKVYYTNTGLFSEYVQTLGNTISATAGLRFDYNSRFGGTFNPRVGLVWKPTPDITVKGMYGTAYLAPSPQYTYDQYGYPIYNAAEDTFEFDFAQLSNPDLQPQTIETTEAEFKYLISENFVFDASMHFSESSGIISPITLQGTNNGYTLEGYTVNNPQIYQNLGIQTIYGINLNIDYQNKFSENTILNMYFNYGFLEGTLDKDETRNNIRNLPGISNHTFKFGGSLKNKGLLISPRFIAMTAQRVINTGAVNPNNNKVYQTIPGYLIGNIFIEYRFPNFGVFVKGYNIFDNRYKNVNLGAAPEGNGTGSARIEFQEGAPQNPIRLIGGFRLRLN